MGETSLLIFSFCMQAAIGMMLFITLAEQLYNGKSFKIPAIIAAGLSVIGIFASLMHLGRPMAFLNSLSNLGSSWLSYEALVCGIFAGIAVLYALLQHFKPASETLNLVLRWAGSIVGLIAVFSMAKLYSSTIVPVWHGANTFVEFYATTIAVGALLFIVTSLKQLNDVDKRIYSIAVFTAVIIQAAVAVPHALSLSAEGMAAQTSAAILSNMGAVIGLKWLLILGSAGILMWPSTQRSEIKDTRSIYMACAFLVVGQLIGRYIFYAALVATNVGLT